MFRNSRRIFSCQRYLRTLHPSQRVIDIESQLQNYPREIRNEVLNKIHHQTGSGETGPAGAGLNEVVSKPKLSGTDYLATIVSAYLQNITAFDELDSSFWQTACTLARSATKERDPRHLELFSMLFEAAKHIPYENTMRGNMIYELGRYIYRQKKVRLDPVNEVEFLDALVSHKRASHALKLWNSRKSRQEVAGSEYWTELGVLYYLDGQSVTRANELALSMQSPSVRNMIALIAAWGRPRKTRSLPEDGRKWCEFWTERLCSKLRSNLEKPDTDQMISPAIAALIAARQWDLAAKLLDLNVNGSQLNQKTAIAALNGSAKYVPTNYEQDFVPVLEHLVAIGDDMALQSSLQSSLALHYAFLKDEETARQILDDSDLEKLGIPPAFQIAFSQLALKNQLQWPEKLKSSPYAVLTALKSTKISGDVKRNIWRAAKLSGENRSVLIEVLRNRIVAPPEMLRLICQNPCVDAWTQLWFMMATRKIDLNGKTVLAAQLKLSPTQINVQHLVYIAHVLPVAEILAALAKAPPGPALSKVSAAVFVKAVKSAQKAAKTLPVRKPIFKLTDHGEREVTWGEISENLKRHL